MRPAHRDLYRGGDQIRQAPCDTPEAPPTAVPRRAAGDGSTLQENKRVMIAPLLARLVLAVFVTPFLLLTSAIIYALAASQAGEYVATVVMAAALLCMLLALDRWLGAVAASYGDRAAANHAAPGWQTVRPPAARRCRDE